MINYLSSFTYALQQMDDVHMEWRLNNIIHILRWRLRQLKQFLIRVWHRVYKFVRNQPTTCTNNRRSNTSTDLLIERNILKEHVVCCDETTQCSALKTGAEIQKAESGAESNYGGLPGTPPKASPSDITIIGPPMQAESLEDRIDKKILKNQLTTEENAEPHSGQHDTPTRVFIPSKTLNSCWCVNNGRMKRIRETCSKSVNRMKVIKCHFSKKKSKVAPSEKNAVSKDTEQDVENMCLGNTSLHDDNIRRETNAIPKEGLFIVSDLTARRSNSVESDNTLSSEFGSVSDLQLRQGKDTTPGTPLKCETSSMNNLLSSDLFASRGDVHRTVTANTSDSPTNNFGSADDAKDKALIEIRRFQSSNEECEDARTSLYRTATGDSSAVDTFCSVDEGEDETLAEKTKHQTSDKSCDGPNALCYGTGDRNSSSSGNMDTVESNTLTGIDRSSWNTTNEQFQLIKPPHKNSQKLEDRWHDMKQGDLRQKEQTQTTETNEIRCDKHTLPKTIFEPPRNDSLQELDLEKKAAKCEDDPCAKNDTQGDIQQNSREAALYLSNSEEIGQGDNQKESKGRCKGCKTNHSDTLNRAAESKDSPKKDQCHQRIVRNAYVSIRNEKVITTNEVVARFAKVSPGKDMTLRLEKEFDELKKDMVKKIRKKSVMSTPPTTENTQEAGVDCVTTLKCSENSEKPFCLHASDDTPGAEPQMVDGPFPGPSMEYSTDYTNHSSGKAKYSPGQIYEFELGCDYRIDNQIAHDTCKKGQISTEKKEKPKTRGVANKHLIKSLNFDANSAMNYENESCDDELDDIVPLVAEPYDTNIPPAECVPDEENKPTIKIDTRHFETSPIFVIRKKQDEDENFLSLTPKKGKKNKPRKIKNRKPALVGVAWQ